MPVYLVLRNSIPQQGVKRRGDHAAVIAQERLNEPSVGCPAKLLKTPTSLENLGRVDGSWKP